MHARILLITALGLLAGCEYLASFSSDDEAAAQENSNLRYSDYQQVVVEARNIRVAVEAAVCIIGHCTLYWTDGVQH